MRKRRNLREERLFKKTLEKKKKSRRRRIVIMVELLLLIILGAGAYGIFKLDKLGYTGLDSKNLEVYQDTGPYTNIALFGLDSREGETESGVQSDSIMIASINNKTHEVKVVSVFRDTFLQQADGTYDKANAAYSKGGPEEAIAQLNRNLDLDIQSYMSVNFNALVDVIDLLGGVEINVEEEEIVLINGYGGETSRIVGKETTQITEVGAQVLDGIQATSYARIRYTVGDDFKRAERQRTVLSQIIEKAKKADILTLNKIVDQVFPQVSTSLTASDLMGIAANVLKYELGETRGFPFDVTTGENFSGYTASYVIPVGLKSNVTQLHEFLFGNDGYEPSKKVQSISDEIVKVTGVSEDAAKIHTPGTTGYEEPVQDESDE